MERRLGSRKPGNNLSLKSKFDLMKFWSMVNRSRKGKEEGKISEKETWHCFERDHQVEGILEKTHWKMFVNLITWEAI